LVASKVRGKGLSLFTVIESVDVAVSMIVIE